MWNEWLDLALGSRCLICSEAGTVVCALCRAALPERGIRSWPDPLPPGLAPVFVATSYADPVKTLLLAHKERGVYGLAKPLGRLLAVAVEASGLTGVGLHLIAVPSSRHAVRRRGHDPVARMVRAAARDLSARGQPAVAVPLLRQRHLIADQAGLDAGERSRNLREALVVDHRLLRRWAGRPVLPILCDDIVTTGATATEAQRALAAVGIELAAVAAVAATERRKARGPWLG